MLSVLDILWKTVEAQRHDVASLVGYHGPDFGARVFGPTGHMLSNCQMPEIPFLEGHRQRFPFAMYAGLPISCLASSNCRD